VKRGHYTTEAVALNSVDYGESDRIVTFYTEDHGKLGGIAKGARRSRRRFVGNLDPLCHVRLLFFHPGGGALSRVENVTLLEGFGGLKADIERYALACYMLELTGEMTGEGHPVPGLFAELMGFLRLLDRSCDPDSLLRFFEIKLLSTVGYLPHLGGCVVCREESGNGRLFFSPEKGGAVCRACAPGAGNVLAMSAGTERFLVMASRLALEKLPRLVPGPAFVKEGGEILQGFIEYHIGKELKTRKFIDKMKAAAS